MTYSEIIEETENYRVRLILDEAPDEPYDCSQSPLLRIDSSYGSIRQVKHIQIGDRPTKSDDDIEHAVMHWSTSPSDDNWRLFEKYLRVCFGTRNIETWYSGSGGYWYVTYDTKEWRDHVTDNGRWSDTNVKPDMEEYKAWCNGDVYGYEIEQRVHVESTKKVTPPGGTSVEQHSDYHDWQPTDDSCWGFYGYEWAIEAAKEAFEGWKTTRTAN